MDYLYIRAWEEMMCSLPYYLELQLQKTRADKAPETATHKRSDGTWATFEDIQREDTRREIRAIVERMSGETPT